MTVANIKNVATLHGDGLWIDGAVFTGTTANLTVLAQVTNLDTGFYLVAAAGSCQVAWVYDLQQRASDGVTIKHTQRRRPAAGNEDFIFANKFNLAQGDQLVIVLAEANVTGTLQMSLLYQGVG